MRSAKRPIHILLHVPTLVGAVFLLLAQRSEASDSTAEPVPPRLEYIYLAFEKVDTDALATAARSKVEGVEGVRSFEWTTPRTEAKVTRVVGQAGTAALVALLAESGIPAAPIAIAEATFVFQKALHCNGCVIKVKRALKAVVGTKEIRVAADRRSVDVVYASRRATPQQLRDALAGVGYPAVP